MKRKIYLIAGIILLTLVWGINAMAAASTASDKNLKIGFINLREIIQTSNAGKKAADELKKIYDKDTQELKSTEDELKKLKDELSKKDTKLTPAELRDKEETYKKKLRAYQLQVNDINEELKKRDLEVLQKLMPGIMKVVNDISEKEKYTIMFDVSTTPFPYYAPGNEITKRVVEEFNKLQ